MSDGQDKLYQLITVNPLEEWLFLNEDELIRHLAEEEHGDVFLIRKFYLDAPACRDDSPTMYTEIVSKAETGGEK